MRKAAIEINGDTLIIDGIRVSFDVIPQFLHEMANPDPRKWYNFRREGDELLIHVEYRHETQPEANNGNYVRERSRSSEDVGSQRQEATHPLDADRPN